MVRGEKLEHANQPAHHPAVAAAPEDLAAIGLAPREKGAVPEIEVLRRIVEVVGGLPPFLHREIEVGLLAGRGIEAHPRGRTHEERIAPGPVVAPVGIEHPVINEVVVLGMGQDIFEPRDRRREHLGVAVAEVELREDLPHAVIVRVVGRPVIVAESPSGLFPHLHHRVVEARTGGKVGQRHRAGVEGGLRPEGGLPPAGICQLPVGRALHDVQNGGGRERRGRWRGGRRGDLDP